MTREEIYNDIKETLGSVPGFIAKLDDAQLEPTWEKTKKTFLSKGETPCLKGSCGHS